MKKFFAAVLTGLSVLMMSEAGATITLDDPFYYPGLRGDALEAERAACSKGEGESCYRLALEARFGMTVFGAKKEEEAFSDAPLDYALRSCSMGSENGCSFVYTILLEDNIDKILEHSARTAKTKPEDNRSLLFTVMGAAMTEGCAKGVDSACYFKATMDDNWVAAYEALWRGAGKGSDLSASLLGRIYLTGMEETDLNIAPNPSLAKVILEKACRAGGKYSCLTLAASRLVPPHEQHRLQRALCESGNMVEACEAIVSRRANDPAPEAKSLFERACRLGSPGGCKARIEYREHEFRASDEIRELQRLISKPAASVTKEEEGRIAQLRDLITRFEEELDVYKRAACYRGDSESCLELAERNLKTKNYTRAKAFLEIGIDDPRLSKDRSECLVALARLYHEGKGVKKDSTRALDLLEKACPTSSKACQLGGEIALGAGGAKRNVERARSFYGRLCDDGRLLGCEKVSELNTVIAKR